MFGKYFYGNEISQYGQEHGFVDYATLAKAFDAVLNNDIIARTCDIGYWEHESGFVDNSEEIEELQEKIEELQEKIDELEEQIKNLDEETEESKIEELENEISSLESKIEELEAEQDESPEIFQYWIVSDNGARILKEFNEIVFYNEELDMYVWGVTHWGTSWDYVLTNIPCNAKDEDC